MVIPNKLSTLLAIALAGLLLMFAPLAGAAINTGLPSYDKLMQTELDSLMDQVAGQFENTGGYLEKSEFYSVLEQGLKGQGNIRTAFDKAQEAQNKSDADKNNPELQELARIAMDDLFLAVLYQVELNKALATADQEITTLLIDILEGRGEGFSEEEGPFILDALAGRPGDDPLPEEDDPEDDPEDPEPFTFLFYGKAYDLDTDINLANSINGILYFDSGSLDDIWSFNFEEQRIKDYNYPTSIWPLFIRPDSKDDTFETYEEYLTHRYQTPQLNIPKLTKNDGFYRYTWKETFQEVESPPVTIPLVSTSLYKNSNIISFVYGDFSKIPESYRGDYYFDIGLHPGYVWVEEELGEGDYTDWRAVGGPNQPGEGLERTWGDWRDLSEQVGERFYWNDGMNYYLPIFEHFRDSDDYEFDLSEKFVVWIPDASLPMEGEGGILEGFSQPDEGIGNQYTIHTGSPLMVVDRSRHHYDEELSSLDEAINYFGDNDIDMSEFLAGNLTVQDGMYEGEFIDYRLYEYDGWWMNYQTPIRDEQTWDGLYESNFLAYAVQVEEDRLNEKIRNMYDPATYAIEGLRDYTSIRDRDAWFAENADKKAGRVMKDIHGNWVRVQQYILRQENANDTTSVKLLNVSLRGAGAVTRANDGDLSGMSTIDFTTVFDTAIQKIGNVRDLPWAGYLTTKYDGAAKYIEYGIPYDYNEGVTYDGPVPVVNMSVKFTNAGDESVTEFRNFKDAPELSEITRQYVKSETLTLDGDNDDVRIYNNNFDGQNTYQYMSYFANSDPSRSGYYDVLLNEDGSPALDETLLARQQNEDNPRISALQKGKNKLLSVNLHMVSDDPDGIPQQWEYKAPWYNVSDIWAVLGAGESTDSVAAPFHYSIEIEMNNDDIFAEPIDTIFIPMSHMDWFGGPA